MSDPARVSPEDLAAHQNALVMTEELTSRYTAALLYIAKGLAFGDGSDMVQSKHISEAEIMLRKRQERGMRRELMIIFGGAGFGAFVQGAAAELLSKTPNHGLLAVYIVLGIVGLAVVVLSMRLQS